MQTAEKNNITAGHEISSWPLSQAEHEGLQ